MRKLLSHRSSYNSKYQPYIYYLNNSISINSICKIDLLGSYFAVTMFGVIRFDSLGLFTMCKFTAMSLSLVCLQEINFEL